MSEGRLSLDTRRRLIEHYARRAAEGDGNALLNALYCSLEYDLPLPDEVRLLAVECLLKYSLFEVRTLDDAFGVSRPKGFRLDDHRRRSELGIPVYNAVEALREGDISIEVALEDVASRLGTSRTVAAELYYEVKNKL